MGDRLTWVHLDFTVQTDISHKCCVSISFREFFFQQVQTTKCIYVIERKGSLDLQAVLMWRTNIKQ